MKKNILSTLHSYLNGDTTVDITEARDYINAEYNKQVSASQAKADAYAAAKPIVLGALTDTPVTLTALFESVTDSLPEGFTKSKVQYGLTHYWTDEVKIEKDGKANTYAAC